MFFTARSGNAISLRSRNGARRVSHAPPHTRKDRQTQSFADGNTRQMPIIVSAGSNTGPSFCMCCCRSSREVIEMTITVEAMMLDGFMRSGFLHAGSNEDYLQDRKKRHICKLSGLVIQCEYARGPLIFQGTPRVRHPVRRSDGIRRSTDPDRIGRNDRPGYFCRK